MDERKRPNLGGLLQGSGHGRIMIAYPLAAVDEPHKVLQGNLA